MPKQRFEVRVAALRRQFERQNPKVKRHHEEAYYMQDFSCQPRGSRREWCRIPAFLREGGSCRLTQMPPENPKRTSRRVSDGPGDRRAWFGGRSGSPRKQFCSFLIQEFVDSGSPGKRPPCRSKPGQSRDRCGTKGVKPIPVDHSSLPANCASLGPDRLILKPQGKSCRPGRTYREAVLHRAKRNRSRDEEFRGVV